MTSKAREKAIRKGCPAVKGVMSSGWILFGAGLIGAISDGSLFPVPNLLGLGLCCLAIRWMKKRGDLE